MGIAMDLNVLFFFIKYAIHIQWAINLISLPKIILLVRKTGWVKV